MEYERVVGLRDELLDRFELRPRPVPEMRFSRGGARSRWRAPRAQIALGIAPGARQGDFYLAVRPQGEQSVIPQIVGEITEICKGEVDIQPMEILRPEGAAWLRGKSRPMRVGVSISNIKGAAGTLGLFVESEEMDGQFILSNNHVLLDPAGRGECRIIQPGRNDLIKSADVVADLVLWKDVVVGQVNVVDAAIARIRDPESGHVNNIPGLGSITQVSNVPGLFSGVAKIGRTTGLTYGRILGKGICAVSVAWDGGVAFFDDCIEVGAFPRKFSNGGDSGSVICDLKGGVFGHLFCGGWRRRFGVRVLKITYATPLTTVFSELKLRLL